MTARVTLTSARASERLQKYGAFLFPMKTVSRMWSIGTTPRSEGATKPRPFAEFGYWFAARSPRSKIGAEAAFAIGDSDPAAQSSVPAYSHVANVTPPLIKLDLIRFT